MTEQTPRLELKGNILWNTLYFFVFALTAIFHLSTFHSEHNWGPDFARYIGQSISLVEGFEYLDLYKQVDIFPNFPWGFPLILAPAYKVFGFDLIKFKMVVTLFYVLSLPLISYIFREQISYTSRFFMISIFAVSPWFFEFKNHILSDLPYLFFSLLSLILIQTFIVSQKVFLKRIFGYTLVGISVSVVIYLRTQGFLFIPLLILFQYLSWRERTDSNHQKSRFDGLAMIELVPILIIICAYITGKLFFPSENAVYLRLLQQNIEFRKLLVNTKYYLLLPGTFFGEEKISFILYGITIPFFVRGIIEINKTHWIYVVYSMLTLGLMIIWPYQQGLRFIISLMPFYFFFVFRGLELSRIKLNELKWIPSQFINSTVIVGVVLTVGAGIQLSDSYQDYDKRFIGGPYTPEAKEMFAFLASDTQADAIVMFRKPPVIPLFANRRSIPEIGSVEEIESSLANYYVYHSGLSNKYLLASVEESSDQFRLIFDNQSFKIFAIDPSP